MNKSDLIKSISIGAGVPQATAERVLYAMQESVQSALQRAEKVAVRGFGTFVISDRAARSYYHPQTGQTKIACAYCTVRFVPSKNLKMLIN